MSLSYKIFLLLGLLGINSCAPIDHQRVVQTPVGETLHAGVGDTIISVKKQRNLQNAFGGSDIFGRKTDEGFSELKYIGLRSPSIAVFQRNDAAIYSNETTMSRSGGMYIPNSSTTTTRGTVGGVPYYGSSTTTGPGVFVPSAKADTQVLPPSSLGIFVDLEKDRTITFEGQRVEILEASQSNVTYRILP
jgi:hypothetical protein